MGKEGIWPVVQRLVSTDERGNTAADLEVDDATLAELDSLLTKLKNFVENTLSLSICDVNGLK